MTSKKTVIVSITVEPPESFNQRTIYRYTIDLKTPHKYHSPNGVVIETLNAKRKIVKRFARPLSINYVRKDDIYIVIFMIESGQPNAGHRVSENIPLSNITYVYEIPESEFKERYT